MSPTRRELAMMAAAGVLTPGLARAAPAKVPLVIAHRGASGERPEETRSAYNLAIDEGADFIEPDLVATRDGILVARHENEIGATTNVAQRADYADRKTTKTIDGQDVTGWFTEDFTLAELKTLTCRERMPQLRPASAKFDGTEPILTFQEVIDIARAGSVRTARTIGIYPEMKHPSYFASIGLPLEERLAGVLKANGYNSPASAVFVQCFEPGPLKTFARLSRARRIQLIAAGPQAAEMTAPDALKAIRAYAEGVGVEQSLVLDLDAEPFPAVRPLVADAHAAGLVVHSWTARPENYFLPKRLQRGDSKRADFPRRSGDIRGLLITLYMSRLDGVFTDFPALAVKARAEAMSLMQRQERQRR
ncbi:MAG TPA: glycerophosphodiester phosphodiesterase family protein [Caulobacteraceae bacterium]|nr:glycerophosphodiester phosphodiesterase family protein [Caulobacteraceae bacterium]